MSRALRRSPRPSRSLGGGGGRPEQAVRASPRPHAVIGASGDVSAHRDGAPACRGAARKVGRDQTCSPVTLRCRQCRDLDLVVDHTGRRGRMDEERKVSLGCSPPGEAAVVVYAIKSWPSLWRPGRPFVRAGRPLRAELGDAPVFAQECLSRALPDPPRPGTAWFAQITSWRCR